MSETWKEELYNKYPKLFRQKDLPATETCMCWGIAVGDGWKKIVEEACQQIEEANQKCPDLQVEFVQIKEKFAGLRMYFQIKKPTVDLTGTLEYQLKELWKSVSDIVSNAESISYKTCDVCGEPGKETGSSWIATRCEQHAKK